MGVGVGAGAGAGVGGDRVVGGDRDAGGNAGERPERRSESRTHLRKNKIAHKREEG